MLRYGIITEVPLQHVSNDYGEKRLSPSQVFGYASGDEEYLRDLVVEGACERYGEDWSDELANRIDYELRYIEDSGCADYFLIVADYVQHAREIGHVSPDRGSAANSIVNYCLGITSIDPFKVWTIVRAFLQSRQEVIARHRYRCGHGYARQDVRLSE